MPIQLSAPRREQSPTEELANSLSHGMALLSVLVGTPYLVTHVARRGDVAVLIGTFVFCATASLVYFTSTVYHALPNGDSKRLFRIMEHFAIFLLIAGTYTPFTVGFLRGFWGWTLFALIWGLAVTGMTLKARNTIAHPILSAGLYLSMAWVGLVASAPLSARLPPEGFYWLVAGGLSYTTGIIFFASGARLRFGHLIWHLFVIQGTACHYCAVLWSATGPF